MFMTTLPSKSITRGKRVTMPVDVARWLVENSQLSPRETRRIKALNTKVHNETITSQEEKELDAILDLCLQGDILRAQAMAVLMKQRPKQS